MCPAFLQFWCNVIYFKSGYRNGFHCYLCSCMLDHVCYEPFSLKIADLGDILCQFVEICVLSEIHVFKTRFK